MAWRLIVLVHGIAGRYTLASAAAERSNEHARLAGNWQLVTKNSVILSMNALYGPTPVLEGILQCEKLTANRLPDRQIECSITCALAQLRAMNGELESARGLYRQARATLRDLGQSVFAASTGIDLARVELHGGDLAAAEREVRADYDFLARMGETYFLSTMAALLSRIVRDQGRDEEALALSQVAEGAAAADDMESQALWRSIRAPMVARAGQPGLAEELARGALEIVGQAEAPALKADALAELAAVLQLAGKTQEARAALGEAIALCASKGDVVQTECYRAWDAKLGVG